MPHYMRTLPDMWSWSHMVTHHHTGSPSREHCHTSPAQTQNALICPPLPTFSDPFYDTHVLSPWSDPLTGFLSPNPDWGVCGSAGSVPMSQIQTLSLVEIGKGTEGSETPPHSASKSWVKPGQGVPLTSDCLGQLGPNLDQGCPLVAIYGPCTHHVGRWWRPSGPA